MVLGTLESADTPMSQTEMIVELPKHLLENKARLLTLRRWANSLRGLYGVPVYLCGSALAEHNPNPRDWDIRIELPDEDFERRFGGTEKWVIEGNTGAWTELRWKWSDECVKKTKEGWGQTHLNIDFQIYPESHCRNHYGRHFKARLDTRDEQ